MTTADQLKTLTDKLAALEAQLNGGSGSAATGGSGSSPGEVTVKVPRERKLRKFTGVRDDHLIEDWILDAKRAISSQSEADAVDFLLYHLEGAAKEELRLRPDEEKNTPDAVFKVLRSSFGEGLSSTQAMRKFFERRQKEKESIQDYSHSLMVLLSRVERLNPGAVADKDQLLRDQFLENLYDPQLRRDIKRWARDHSGKSFQQIREEVQRWVDEDGTTPRRAAVREAMIENETTCSEVKGSADLQKVVNELVAGQKLLTEGLQKQQKLLAEQQQAISQLASSTQQWWQPGCFGCGSKTHIKRDCPGGNHGRNQRGGNQNSRRPEHKPPALNEKTPRQ